MVIATVLVLSGCATTETTTTAAPLFAANPAAPRWQQRCENFTYSDNTPLVARLGAEGWEIAAMNNYAICFRRPAP